MNRLQSLLIYTLCSYLYLNVQVADLSAQNSQEHLQDILSNLQENSGVYGLNAAVYLGGELYWEGSAGYSNPFTDLVIIPDMTGAIGSNTKIFTSAIILQLQEEGKLDIDQTIDEWITPSEKINGEITVRQMLNHTSGIGNYTLEAWVDSIRINPNRVWTNQELIDTFVGEPDFAPGSSWNYSNTGYLLLGEIIEQIEEKSYREVLYERILTPFNLSTMYTPIEDEPTAEEITPWFDMTNNGELDNMFDFGLMGMHTSAGAAGYIYSTTADLAKFGHLLFSEQIIPGNALDEMTGFVDTGINSFDYGLGLMIFTHPDKDFMGHNGQYIGYTAILLHEPDTEVTIAIITNDTDGPINDIGFTFMNEALLLIQTSTEPEPYIVSNSNLAQNYPNPFNPVTIIEFQLSERANVNLSIYDLLGRKVAVLVDKELASGSYTETFDASGLPSGLYFYKLNTGSKVISRTMTLIK